LDVVSLPLAVSSHPLFGHWLLGVMLEKQCRQASLGELCSECAPGPTATKRIIVGCPLARSAAWCPVSKKDNMAPAILRMVYRYKYRALLSTHYQKHLYHLNRHHRTLHSHLPSLRFRVAEVFFKHSHPFRPHHLSRPSYHNHEVFYLLQTENGRRLWCCAA
jgi:hypothetical protein